MFDSVRFCVGVWREWVASVFGMCQASTGQPDKGRMTGPRAAGMGVGIEPLVSPANADLCLRRRDCLSEDASVRGADPRCPLADSPVPEPVFVGTQLPKNQYVPSACNSQAQSSAWNLRWLNTIRRG